MRILTNFMNTPASVELPGGGQAEVLRSESWPGVKKLLAAADLIVVDCRDSLLYKIAGHFLRSSASRILRARTGASLLQRIFRQALSALAVAGTGP